MSDQSLAFICHTCHDIFTRKVPTEKVVQARIPASKYCSPSCRKARKKGRGRRRTIEGLRDQE